MASASTDLSTSQQYRKMIANAQLFHSDGKPPGTNCCALYSWAKGCRSYFSQDVVTAVHIRVQNPFPTGIIPTSITTPTESGWLFP